MYPFQPKQTYKRREVKQIVGLPEERMLGGNWDTGYVRHGDDHFVFVNVGTAGNVGPDYPNEWVGESRLRWYGKSSTTQDSPSIRAMVRSVGNVYVFWRTDNRDPFEFAGLGFPLTIDRERPVEVVWDIRAPHAPSVEDFGPLEVQDVVAPAADAVFTEGRPRVYASWRYERNRKAREVCIRHYGPRCFVCGFDYEARYGPLGKDFIHVHHLVPLHLIGTSYKVHAIDDLRPLCANCHEMIHRRDPMLSIRELQDIIRVRAA